MPRPRDLSRYADPAPVYTGSQYGLDKLAPLFLAALAYPEADEEAQRLSAALQMIDQVAAEQIWREPVNSPTLEHASPKRSGVGVSMARVQVRLRKRLVFGLLVLQPMLALDSGEPPQRRTWGGAWNRAEAIREAVKKDDLGDIRNFDRDYWRPAVPIAHMAAALVTEIKTLEKQGDQWSLLRFISDPAYAVPLIARAEQMEDLVARSDIGIPAALLIKVRLQS